MEESKQIHSVAGAKDATCGSYPGVSRFSVAHCMFAIIIAYIGIPFLKHFRHGILIEDLLVTGMMLFSLLAVGRTRKTLVWAILLVTPAYICKWANYFHPDPLSRVIALGAAVIFCIFVAAQLLRFIFCAVTVDSEVLSASVVTYLIMALAWAFCYDLIALIVPGAFSFTIANPEGQSMVGFTGLYFSFITLNTVGYGDIVPVSAVARMFAMAEASFGMFYMVMVISRLVSMYSHQQKRR